MEAHPEFSLASARIERVDRPLPGLFAFSLAQREGRAVLLVAAGPPRSRVRWALASTRPRGDFADPIVRGLREKLEGGVVTRVWRVGAGIALEARHGDVVWEVEATPRGLACAPPISGSTKPGEAIDSVTLEPGEAFVAEHRRALAEGARTAARASLRKLAAKLARRVLAIGADLSRVEEAEKRAALATPLVPVAARARPGSRELVAVDWSTGAPREVRFPLDPAKPARAQVEAVFAEAKRLRAGARIGSARAREAQIAIALLEDALSRVDGWLEETDVDAELRTLGRALPPGVRLDAARPAAPTRAVDGVGKRAPFRRYLAANGAPILVGRDARGNDALTVRLAKPGDLWLHAKGGAGAHVVVSRWYRSGGLDAETLIDAATLAAHFSDERDETIVDVAYVDRRYVRKRRGAAPGLVEVTQEKVLPLRVEPARLARLLATCDT